MRSTQRDPLIITVAITAAIVVVSVLAFVLWQSSARLKEESEVPDAAPTNQVSMDFITGTDLKKVSTTLKGWPVSLEMPSMWKTEVDYTTFYNHDSRRKEVGNIVTITHPSKKVSIILQQYPFFSADGVCGPTALRYMNKDAMTDDRIVFVEAVGEEQAFMLSATTKDAADAFTDDFNSCLGYRNLINAEAQSIVFPLTEQPYHEEPFVSVSIRPTFVTEEDGKSWDGQMIVEFLETKEYLETKQIVKMLKI